MSQNSPSLSGESRKVSERVKAGQQVSRKKGVVYGCGNILGYTRKPGGTYEIDEEQAETVRMIYEMYFRIRGTRKRGSYINAVTVSASKCELNEQSTTCRLRPLLKVYAVILL